jgi:hypothetical protein
MEAMTPLFTSWLLLVTFYLGFVYGAERVAKRGAGRGDERQDSLR